MVKYADRTAVSLTGSKWQTSTQEICTYHLAAGSTLCFSFFSSLCKLFVSYYGENTNWQKLFSGYHIGTPNCTILASRQVFFLTCVYLEVGSLPCPFRRRQGLHTGPVSFDLHNFHMKLNEWLLESAPIS